MLGDLGLKWLIGIAAALLAVVPPPVRAQDTIQGAIGLRGNWDSSTPGIEIAFPLYETFDVKNSQQTVIGYGLQVSFAVYGIESGTSLCHAEKRYRLYALDPVTTQVRWQADRRFGTYGSYRGFD